VKSILFTDLDGTLLDRDSKLSWRNRKALWNLGHRGFLRVAVTGRSLFSAQQALKKGFPLEYLITSNGAGIFDFRSGELITSYYLSQETTAAAIELLLSLKVDFMVHAPVPDNHNFVFHRSGGENHDFSSRCERYRDFCSPLDPNHSGSKKASQFLIVVTPDKDPEYQHRVFQDLFPKLSVIRTTSPLDQRSCWIEIFPPLVSKAKAADWLSRYLGMERRSSFAVGNDYNDLDLLEWSHRSVVVANAPAELRRRFTVVAGYDRDGFAEAVEIWTS
tara:strand:+ start:8270 stop:9094 length:825 start_codon:yes stop_codon:yes gene_type:complete